MKGRILFIPHGGGPLPLLGDPAHRGMVDLLQGIAAMLPQPERILLISAHWEAAQPTLLGSGHPPMMYDYYGFPPEAYRIRYPAPGTPELACRAAGLLQSCGFAAKVDDQRGFDHGMFVPLKLMFPDAQIPCTQLSLLASLDPAEHIRMGEAIAPLLEGNVLLIGSGFSFHHLPAFFTPADAAANRANAAFEAWLLETCTDAALDEHQRKQRLIAWAEAPGAGFCHPREEHLLPLHSCYGAAGRAAAQAFSIDIMGKTTSAFLW